MGLLAAALLTGLGLGAIRLWPALFGSGRSIAAVFNAPMMVVRASLTGKVMTVTAVTGQMVEPQSLLLTIRASSGGADQPVLAGVHGVVRSVETVPGAELAAGSPLVRLQDCDRAFLTVPPAPS